MLGCIELRVQSNIEKRVHLHRCGECVLFLACSASAPGFRRAVPRAVASTSMVP